MNRYNERRALHLVHPRDIIKAIMLDTRAYHFTELEETAPGVFKIFAAADSGYPLGMYNKNLGLIKFNTFITPEMLHKDQRLLEDDLKNYLDKYKEHSALLE